MNLVEYNLVKDMTYLEYCDYLQQKYGIGKANYFSKNWNKSSKISRTKEGLLTHHKMEDRMILLSNKSFAQMAPYEYQLKENLVYCDYLEHLFLHILICEYPYPEIQGITVGIGGAVDFLIPELNDFYSGWKTKQSWRQSCHSLIKDDINVYYILLERFIKNTLIPGGYPISIIQKSFNEPYDLWKNNKNKKIYKKINKIYNNNSSHISLLKKLKNIL